MLFQAYLIGKQAGVILLSIEQKPKTEEVRKCTTYSIKKNLPGLSSKHICTNTGVPSFIEQILLDIKSEINPNINPIVTNDSW